MALTETFIKTAPTGMHSDGRGLYLQVGENTKNKSWIFRFTLNGKRRDMGLGSLTHLSAKQARGAADKARALVANSIDPIVARKQALVPQAHTTFMNVANEYIEAHKSGWKNTKHGAQWTNTLTKYAEPVFKNMDVASIGVAEVLKVLTPVWNTKTETASRVLNRIELVLNYAKVKGLRSGENPALWRGNLDNVLPKPTKVKTVVHHPAMPFADMATFMTNLRQQNGMGAKALEFTILTAGRSGDTRGAVWSEFNLDNALWTIPAARMKAGKEHRVPLSHQAVELLKGLPRFNGCDVVFAGVKNQPLSDMSLSAVLRRMAVPFTVHGFRSSFRDWVAERTSYPSDLAELALAHKVGTDVENAYRRSDMLEKRRDLMKSWSNYCSGLTELSLTSIVKLVA